MLSLSLSHRAGPHLFTCILLTQCLTLRDRGLMNSLSFSENENDKMRNCVRPVIHNLAHYLASNGHAPGTLLSDAPPQVEKNCYT